MSMTLYHGEPNGPSFTVLAALFETGLEAELVHIDLTDGARHALDCAGQREVAMSIEGEGPVLVRNGEAMTDSVFIARFLNDAGNNAIVPGDAYSRWRMMTHCRQTIERVSPASAYLAAKQYLQDRYAAMSDEQFATITDKIASDDLKWRWIDIRNGDFSEDKLADSQDKIAAAIDAIDEQTAAGDWILDSFSIADLESYAWLAGLADAFPALYKDKTSFAAWRARIEARPAVAKALSLQRSDSPAKSWAPGPEINRWG